MPVCSAETGPGEDVAMKQSLPPIKRCLFGFVVQIGDYQS